MDKLAQKRSIPSKIWEKVNLTGKALESMHPEFAAKMDSMRTIDEEIRTIAEDVKPLIRHAKSAFRQRDYLSAAYNITGFHKRVKYISHILDQFVKNLNLEHHKFLLDQFEDPYKNELLGYDPNATIKDACDKFENLVKEAGPVEWAKENILNIYDIGTGTAANLITDKGRARRLMEKRFSASFIKRVRTLTELLIKKSEKMMRDLITIFSTLESGISRRNVALYEKQAKLFVAKFTEYHAVYENYHKEILTPLKAQHDDMTAKQKAKDDQIAQEKQQQAEEAARQQAAREQAEVEEAKKSPLVTPFKEPAYKEPSFEEWKDDKSPTGPMEAEKNELLDKLKKEHGKEQMPFLPGVMQDAKEEAKHAHSDFLDQLTIYAQAHEISAFVRELLDYSNTLEDVDPVASSQLLTIAEHVVDDYKTAGLFDFLKNKGKPTVEQTEEVAQQAEVAAPLQELQRGPEGKKKDKPEDLVNEQEQLYRPKKIDLPEGRIDQAYSDIPVLANITANQIRVTGPTARLIINTVLRRLAAVLKIDDLEPYISSVEQKLIPVIKQAIYDGWVVSSDSTMDSHNPRDKFVEIYTRLNLSQIDNKLAGTAKLYVSCRLSADHGTLTIRGLNKHFIIDVPKATAPQASSDDNEEHYDEHETDLYGDHNDQYDE